MFNMFKMLWQALRGEHTEVVLQSDVEFAFWVGVIIGGSLAALITFGALTK